MLLDWGRGFQRLARRDPAAVRHIHLLRWYRRFTGVGEEPSMADVDAYLDVWIFIDRFINF